MSFVFNQKMSFLEVGKHYKGTVTSASLISDDKNERILINVTVPNFVTPSPASFNVSNKKGKEMALQFLTQIGAELSDDIKVTLDSIKGKEVNVSLTEVEENGVIYQNTRINAPRTISTQTQAQTQEETLAEDDLAI